MAALQVPVVGVIGWSGAGKTELVTRLLPELKSRGLRVAAVKHSGHPHPLHRPGSDSQAFVDAGAAAVGFATPEGFSMTTPADALTAFDAWRSRFAGEFDLALVEGWKDAPWPRIEVWRKGHGELLAPTHPGIRAIVSDVPVPSELPRFTLAEAPGIALFVLKLAREAAA